jgi:hypothetical protein
MSYNVPERLTYCQTIKLCSGSNFTPLVGQLLPNSATMTVLQLSRICA